MKETRDKIRHFIRDNFLFGGEDDFLDGDSFLEMGLIDSTGVLELVNYLETEWDLRIADEELVPENLDSIDRIVAFLERKRMALAGRTATA